MVKKISKTFWIAVTLLVATASVVKAEVNASCYFVFGDSVFDNGNNNGLITKAKVNYSPYGIDFSNGPTGRFSNGRNIPDFIAELIGINNYIPPFAGTSPTQAYTGINYASGAAGIREETSQTFGDRISLSRQIVNHRSGIAAATVPQHRLMQCLYTINIGSNDYLNNYFLPLPYNTNVTYNPDQYAESLVTSYRCYLKELYELGARNVALFGIGKIGCIPRVVASHGRGLGCAEEVNQAVKIFNTNLKALVDDFNNNLHGVKFTYVDLYSGDLSEFPDFVADKSCCTVEPGEELCEENRPVCANRSKYIFWDNVHTTEAINAVIANAAFSGITSSPHSLAQLVNLTTNNNYTI